MAKRRGMAPCEEAVVAMLRELNAERMRLAAQDGDAFLDAAANARLVRDAESYYRAMYYGSAESWNVRDRHMFDTLCQVLEARGPASKAVVWAHNSHIGDARATEMGWTRDELNIGQLCRERFGCDAVLIGFGTHTGAVVAADDWDGPMQVKRVKPVARGFPTSGSRMTAACPAFCSTCGPASTSNCASNSPNADSSGSSASSIGPIRNVGATIPNANCPRSSTRSYGSTKPQRSRRSSQSHGPDRRRPTRSGSEPA